MARHSDSGRRALFPRASAGSLKKDAMAMAPADKHVDGPDTRPIQTGCSMQERRPQPLDRRGGETAGCDGARIPQDFVHGVLQAAPYPAVERQDEPAFGPI